MKIKNTPKLDSKKSSELAWNLIEFGRKEGKEKNFNSKLASVLIYSNLAEYLSWMILERCRINVEKVLLNNKSKVHTSILYEDQKEPTNLEYTISQLIKYQFPNKENIIPLLKKIKDNRNKLFHNLIFSVEKGEKPYDKIKNIQIDTEKLFNLCSSFYKELNV